MVSIAGGEPLPHPDLHELVDRLIERRGDVVQRTEAVLIPKRLRPFRPMDPPPADGVVVGHRRHDSGPAHA
jgi:hypothetical protein